MLQILSGVGGVLLLLQFSYFPVVMQVNLVPLLVRPVALLPLFRTGYQWPPVGKASRRINAVSPPSYSYFPIGASAEQRHFPTFV